MGQIAAWLVHLYTASSSVIGVLAIVACFRGELRLALYWMLLALVVDSTDGALARAVEVRRRLPWIDGRRLDDICDYFTYVLVPACFLVAAQLLPHPAWVAAPILASAYGFSQDDAKTPDHFFLGWPSYWNVVVPYLWLLEVPPGRALAVVLAFSAAVFVPLRYIYPSRTRPLRPLTLAVLCAWIVGFSWVALRPDPDPAALRVTLLGPGYYLGVSLWFNLPRTGGAS